MPPYYGPLQVNTDVENDTPSIGDHYCGSSVAKTICQVVRYPTMFGTSGIRGPIGETVTADTALSVGRALASEGYQTVVIGRDPRDSGRMLAKALSSGLEECGADVIRLGQAATPTVARSVSWQDADAGVSITASHNPSRDNGLKLWTPSGQAFDAEQRDRIAARVEAGE